MRSFALVLVVVTLSSSSAPGDYELSNGIAAIANGSVITVQDVQQASAEAVDLYRRTYFNNPKVFAQKRITAMSEALEQLIDRQLVLHDFKTIGGVIQESYIDDAIKDKIRERYGDRVTLTKTLQAQGITYETFRQRMRDEIISALMERKNVREAILVSPAKIERYYQTNLHRFKLGDQVKLRMIMLSRGPGSSADEIRQLASEIKMKIDEGAPFADMASVYSDGPWRKEAGLWGWKEESQLKKGLSEIAFALKPGECSKVVGLATTTDEGYWIYQYERTGQVTAARQFTDRDAFIEERKFGNQTGQDDLPVLPQEFYLMQVDEKQVARTRSLQEVRDEIEKDLLLQERARLQKKWIERLRTKSFVQYFYF
jgi:peptidyl-prolyl cis-trans isomerase SurA